MDLSVIRSTFSFDSPRTSPAEASFREGELIMEVERLVRRNSLLERSKQVLEEEMQLFKEEIESKNRRIEQLAQKLNKTSSFVSPPSPCQTQKYDDSHLQVILLEKEEQISVIAEELRAKSSRLEELEEENRQLRSELNNRNAVVKQLRESSRAQLSYQQSQIESLEQELQDKAKEIAAMKVFFQNLAQKESSKWQKLNDNLRQQLRMAHEEKDGIILKESNLATEREQLKQKNEELREEISNLNENISFLKSLLQEAKGEFINVQIKQQEQLEKEEREKREYIKRNKLLKTQIKGLKMDSGNNSTSEASNKSTRTASIISITPFRTSSGRSKPIEE